jgi:hypothetical protein
MILAMALEVRTEAKTCEMIVTHVEADLEDTPQPPTWRAKCWWILCHENTGYHTKDPKDSNIGAVRMRSRVRQNTTMEDLTRRRAHRMTESDTNPYPGSGPLW